MTGPLFVGRDLELETLRARLLRARDGLGSVVALVGEAGVGKSTVASAFAAYARGEGARVAMGVCADGVASRPLHPWGDALGAIVASLGPRRARRALGAARGPLAHVIPGVGNGARAEPLDAREERLRMHHAVTELLARAADDAPLVLVLDDLQWADGDALALLAHVARAAARRPWVVLLAYREETSEPTRSALGELIAGLRRDGPFERIALRGFAKSEVAEYLARRAGRELPDAVVRGVFEDTVGNPLYVRELFDHLIEEGWLAKSAEDDSSMRAAPRGVRELVARRVVRLRETTARVVHVACACSEPVDLALLGAVAELGETALLDCVGEAVASGLLRSASDDAYEPSHAVARRAVYDGLSADRRARLHRRIAEALEATPDAPGFAARIATHYRGSAALGGAELGAPHATAAAREATDACAYERAVAFLQVARELGASAPEHVRAEALCELVMAEARAGRTTESLATLDEALAALEAMAAPSADVAAWLAEVARELRGAGLGASRLDPVVERAMTTLGASGDLTWARLVLLGERVESLASGAVHVVRVLPRDARAVAVAREEGDEDDHAATLDHDYRTRAETDDALRCAREWAPARAKLRAYDAALRDLVHRHGAFAIARDVAGEMLAVAERAGAIPAQAEALVQRACCEAVAGEIDAARDTRARAAGLLASLGPARLPPGGGEGAPRDHALDAIALDATLGYFAGCDWRAVATAAARFSADPASRRSPLAHVAAGIAALGYAQAGYARESRSLLAHLAPVFARCDLRVYHYGVALDCAASAVWHLGARDFAEAYRALESGAPRDAGTALHTSRDLALARLAILAEQWDDALAHVARAAEDARVAGLRPLHAIALHDEGMALLRAGGADGAGAAARAASATRARERLAEALATFRALGMDPWIAHAHQLLGLERPSYPDGLTSREVELLRLVASGSSVRAIATTLEIAIPSAQRRIAEVFAKIGASDRAAAAAYAKRHRLAAAC